jgi:hypothetical protein
MIHQHTHDQLAYARADAHRALGRIESLDYDGTGNPDLDARIADLADHASDLARRIERVCNDIGGGPDAR